ncbi:MAG: hypothetical protein DHS20C21_22070 [Gemmatimonadota bacterium]|nr:MAG: hypothetical protein DHS20C21_22070 [Gemmatimonadota bacterium]
MRFGSFEITSQFEIEGGGSDALATNSEGKEVRLWIGAPGRTTGADGAGPDGLRAVLAKVYHSSLPRVLAADVVEDRAVLVVQPYQGVTLAEHLDRLSDPEETSAVLDRTRTLAAALVKAHRNGVVHGALDGRSVFLADDGRHLLLHVGFGAFLEERAAPGPHDTDAAAADVFGLSRLLVRSLAGADSQTPQSPDASAPLPPRPPESFPPHLPEGLRRLLSRAMDPDPARRLRYAEELTGDLSVIRSSWDSMNASPSPSLVPVALVARGGAVLAALAVLAVLVILVVRGC